MNWRQIWNKGFRPKPILRAAVFVISVFLVVLVADRFRARSNGKNVSFVRTCNSMKLYTWVFAGLVLRDEVPERIDDLESFVNLCDKLGLLKLNGIRRESLLLDGWGRPFSVSVSKTTSQVTVIVKSNGKNGNNEWGEGDDITFVFLLNDEGTVVSQKLIVDDFRY